MKKNINEKKNNATELVFILDRSGSMGGLESDTIGGFNAMLEKQKKQEGEAYVTTVLFSNDCETLHDRLPIAGVKPMTEEDIQVLTPETAVIIVVRNRKKTPIRLSLKALRLLLTSRFERI